MAVPTTKSRGSPFKEDFQRLDNAVATAQAVSATQQAAMLAGPVSIEDIIDGLFVRFAAATGQGGIWNTILDLTGNPAFLNYYHEQLRLRFAFDADDVNLATDRITVEGNTFAVGDPVRIEGPGTPPGNTTKGTDYFVFDKNVAGDAVSLKATPGGAIINLITGTASSLFLEYRGIPDINTLTTALEAVIDQIILDVPVTATTLELRSVKFDKALASSVLGIEKVTLSSAQTATLRTKLQDVIDAIEAPA